MPRPIKRISARVLFKFLTRSPSWKSRPPQHPEENQALRNVQLMPMGLRRHAVIILIGNSFQSLHAMQAFRQSVHAVVNPADLHGLKQIIQQVVADTDLFLIMYRDSQTRIAQGKA